MRLWFCNETRGGGGTVEPDRPIGGPMQKQMENAIPTRASDFDRVSGGVMSDKMALYKG